MTFKVKVFRIRFHALWNYYRMVLNPEAPAIWPLFEKSTIREILQMNMDLGKPDKTQTIKKYNLSVSQ